MTYLGIGVDPWWFTGYAVIPAIAWSRVALGHHTVWETVAGGLTGLIVTAVSAAVFLP